MRKFNVIFSVILSLLLVFCVYAEKPRVIVSTDIGGSDPDDFQSMVHFLVYADEMDIEGLISSPPHAGRLSDLREALTAYQTDYSNLSTYADYPTYSELYNMSVQGQTSGGSPSGSRSTDGSQLIVNRANVSDSRPLWVLVWGSITDVAQAVYEDPGIKSKIRVYSIGSWNTAQDNSSRNYLYNNHSDLWWIENDHVFRGMYDDGDYSGDLTNSGFPSNHIDNHGALGELFMAKKSSIKMGDTPSVLYLLSPMHSTTGNWDDPTAESWGGKFKTTGHGTNFYTDIYNSNSTDGESVAKWREDFLRDWQDRMDRCLEENPVQDDTPPSVPSGLGASSAGESSIDLTWTASSDSETGVEYYKIYRGGDSIATSTATSYTDDGLSESTEYTYTVSAVNGAGLESSQSSGASATTDADLTAPEISSVSASGDPNVVTVEFSEAVSQSSAENTANYSIDNGISVSSAVLGSSGKTVSLSVSTLSEGITYTLSVSGVSDVSSAGNTISAGSSSTFSYIAELVITGLSVGSGSAYEWDTLETGKELFIDRDYTFQSVPESYTGEVYLKTANGDKGDASNSISFDVNLDVTVYIIMDDRASVPSWMSDFEDTGDDVVADDASSNLTYSLYSADYSAGTLSFGANGSENMYMLVVVPASGSNTVNMHGKPSPDRIISGISVSPNPFNPSTVITINGVREGVDVELKIYDSRGRIVSAGSGGQLQKISGEYRYNWDA
ncbi:MAG: nucleoside hydrolase-like domain-containing protein, partial [Fibrobacterota bacterium]